MKKSDFALVALFVLLIFFVVLHFGNQGIVQRALLSSEAQARTNVTIIAFLEIEASPALGLEGIRFEILELPYFTNATNNTNILNGDRTDYWVNVTVASVQVDICKLACSDLLTGAGDVINLPNYTWSNDTVNSITQPSIDARKSFTTIFERSALALSQGEADYYRYWLNVSSKNQQAGEYNNTIVYRGVRNTLACGTSPC